MTCKCKTVINDKMTVASVAIYFILFKGYYFGFEITSDFGFEITSLNPYENLSAPIVLIPLPTVTDGYRPLLTVADLH